jgi:hypothetical protein
MTVGSGTNARKRTLLLAVAVQAPLNGAALNWSRCHEYVHC